LEGSDSHSFIMKNVYMDEISETDELGCFIIQSQHVRQPR
jgi:hypothetical protein